MTKDDLHGMASVPRSRTPPLVRRARVRSAALVAASLFATACIAEDLRSLYARDYMAFFGRWTFQAERAALCNDALATAQFLEDAVEMLGNAEVTEANAEFIEKLVAEQPLCLLDGFAVLPPARQRAALRFLVLPLFESESVLSSALAPHWTAGRHRLLFESYLEAREDWDRFQHATEASWEAGR